MPVNPNFTNANAETPYASGGGGVVPGSTINPYVVNFTTGQNSGALWPNPNGNPNDFTLLTYVNWGSSAETFLTASGYSLGMPFGAGELRVGTYGGQPHGVISSNADGITIYGTDGQGNPTQTWFSAGSGKSQLMCCSTITDSQKSGTLDFSAFLSTMASVYPEIVKPYS